MPVLWGKEIATSPLPSLVKEGGEGIVLSQALPGQGRVPNKVRREGCKGKRRTDATTPPSCLRQATSPYTGEAIMGRPWQATVSAAQGKRRLSHGFCPQWQKPQFASRARHTVAMRIMRGSPLAQGRLKSGNAAAHAEKQQKENPCRSPCRGFPCYWTINQPDCS